jgi:hypothetical protein
MEFALAQTFDQATTPWRTNYSGASTGTPSDNNRVWTANSPDTTSTAQLNYTLACTGGTKIKFSIMGKDLGAAQGLPASKGEILLDQPTGTIQNRLWVDSTHWRRYELEYTVPHYIDVIDVQIVLGVLTANAGSVKYANPRLEVIGGGFGALRTMACGLLSINNAGITLNANYVRSGVSSVAWDSSAKNIIVTLTDSAAPTTNNKPLLFTQLCPDSMGGGVNQVPNLNLYAGTIMTGARTFTISPLLPSGAHFDITTLAAGVSLFAFFELRG